MHKAIVIAVAATLAGLSAAAPAQLLGGRAGVGAGVGINAPAIDSTVRGANDAVRGVGDDVRDTTRSTATVKVEAGASTRVDRGTRCYYQPDNYHYDPVYRDGYYYCERSTSGVGARASVATPR